MEIVGIIYLIVGIIVAEAGKSAADKMLVDGKDTNYNWLSYLIIVLLWPPMIGYAMRVRDRK